MDKGFFGYLRNKRDISKIAIALALGLILIFIGGRTDKTEADGGMDIEKRIAAACSEVLGVGECEVFVYSADDGAAVESVIVVCEGGDSVVVRYRLTEMLSSFLGIGANRIKIEKKSG